MPYACNNESEITSPEFRDLNSQNSGHANIAGSLTFPGSLFQRYETTTAMIEFVVRNTFALKLQAAKNIGITF